MCDTGRVYNLTMEELIKSFFKGECSEEQMEQLRNWLNNPKNKEQVDALLAKTWEQSDADIPEVGIDKARMLQGIMKKIESTDGPADRPPKKSRISDREPYRRRKGIPAAFKAILGLAVIMVVVFQVFVNTPAPENTIAQQIRREAPRGYRNTVNLADGSKAILNSESSIEYAADFGKSNRTIVLNGEAFFEVAHNADLPFEVIANGVKTTALGTSFNVNASRASWQTVSLATGKVKVEALGDVAGVKERKEMILSPGEQAVWKRNETSLTKRPFDANLVLSWKDNVIYFKNTRLKRMIRVLERWYDVEITIDGNLDKLTQTGTGTFANESLENVLNSLSFSMGFEYAITDKNVTLQLTNE